MEPWAQNRRRICHSEMLNFQVFGFLWFLCILTFPIPCRQANVVLEARQLAMKIFEDYTVSWYWIIM